MIKNLREGYLKSQWDLNTTLNLLGLINQYLFTDLRHWGH